MKTQYQAGNIRLIFSDIDSLKRGEVAHLKFLTTVPDSSISEFYITTDKFDSDSILFLNILPTDLFGSCITDGNCGLTILKFNDIQTNIFQNNPNPWRDRTEIKFSIKERVPVFIDLYDQSGKKVLTLLDGNLTLSPGEYSVYLNSLNLNSGLYFYTIQAGIFYDTKKMMLIK